jgi:hypothetical protein
MFFFHSEYKSDRRYRPSYPLEHYFHFLVLVGLRL